MQYVFSVYDRKMNLYHNPIFVAHPAEVMRLVSDCVNSPHPYGRHPMDYELVQVAEWDEQTGMFQSMMQKQDPVNLERFVEAKNEKPE